MYCYDSSLRFLLVSLVCCNCCCFSTDTVTKFFLIHIYIILAHASAFSPSSTFHCLFLGFVEIQVLFLKKTARNFPITAEYAVVIAATDACARNSIVTAKHVYVRADPCCPRP